MKFNLNRKQEETDERYVNDVTMFNADLELQSYYDKKENGMLSKEEEQAIKNTDKVLNMSLEDFFNGEFENIIN
ncbi:MAG: hypothetical protein VZS44_11590 [Bacilli bacterium]|nr:hypothetical protein [Bacilli bacterium]